MKQTKTIETYLPPINSKVTDFTTIKNYFDYLGQLSADSHMPYVNITLDIGAAINAFKMKWNYPDVYKDIVIHLGSFHFMRKKISGKKQSI